MANFVDNYFGLTPDPKSSELFLVRSPFNVLVILTVYALFVKKWGPSLMKNRPAFELKGVLIIYNTLQVVLNAYIVFQCSSFLKHRKWIGRCFFIDERYPESVEMARNAAHSYCLLKVVDLLDTVFFVLRKRYNQVTFLHFYHHIMICMVSFTIFRYVGIGHIGVVGAVNSFVHTVMYFYYLKSSLQPDVKSSIWWKKYITIVQILQFVYLTVFLTYPWVNGENCGYPSMFPPLAITQNLLMLVLFSKFYINAYIRKTKPKLK